MVGGGLWLVWQQQLSGSFAKRSQAVFFYALLHQKAHDRLVQRKFKADEIWHFAVVDRVANVIRPYLESVTTRVETWRHRSERV